MQLPYLGGESHLLLGGASGGNDGAEYGSRGKGGEGAGRGYRSQRGGQRADGGHGTTEHYRLMDPGVSHWMSTWLRKHKTKISYRVRTDDKLHRKNKRKNKYFIRSYSTPIIHCSYNHNTAGRHNTLDCINYKLQFWLLHTISRHLAGMVNHNGKGYCSIPILHYFNPWEYSQIVRQSSSYPLSSLLFHSLAPIDRSALPL